MRTRTRLFTTFLAVHVGISVVVGLVTWFGMHAWLRRSAETSATNLSQVLSAGGFTMNADIRQRIETLTGYAFELLPEAGPEVAGTIQVPLGPGDLGVIRIDYRTPEYRRAQYLVMVGTLALVGIGVLLIGLLSWRMAAGLARPLEELAVAAREIGAGDLTRPVPVVGSGEVARLAGDLESMRVHLQTLTEQLRRTERLKTLGLFTAAVAHEVRNPLAALRLTVQLLARRFPEETALAVIINEMERLDLIVDELVSYSGGMRITVVDCSLRQVAGDVVRLLQAQADHAGVILQVDGDAQVQADPARLRQLLLNLVLNAIQASEDGGTVRIRIADRELAVIDAGHGVPPEKSVTLFEAFATGRRDGTGLGLHLAQTIARAHGTEIIYRRGDPGSVFTVTFSPQEEAS